MAEGEGERGLVDGLVEAGEGFPGVDRTELSHRQVAVQKNNKMNCVSLLNVTVGKLSESLKVVQETTET